MTPKIIQRIKGMIQNVAKYYNHGKSPDNKIERFQIFTKKFDKAYDKIEKMENSKFRNVTLDEIQKLINLCKTEQSIVRKYSDLLNF